MIDQSIIDKVKESCDIVTTISEHIRLSRRGRSLTGLCPFHKEKTPSFHVNDDRGYYHCFGCGAHGDVIKFVQDIECLSFVEAVKKLGERAGIQVSDEGEKDEDAELRRALLDVTELATCFYEKQLFEHELTDVALAELARRGIEPGSLAARAFRLGYAPYAWDGLYKYLVSSGASLEAAEKVGLIMRRDNGQYNDRFRHLLMCSILDVNGKVIGFSGRALPDPQREGFAFLTLNPDKQKYINSPESPIYSKKSTLFGMFQAKNDIRKDENAILVEGNFDVISLHNAGICNAVAPLGTAFTAEQAKLIRRFSPKVTIMFDGDNAGRAATEKARQPCNEAGLTVKVARLSEGQDPDDLVRASGANAVTSAIETAKGLIEYLVDRSLVRFLSTQDAKSKANILSEIGMMIGKEPDPVVRALAETYADNAISNIGINDARTFRSVAETIRRESAPRGKAPAAVVIPGTHLEVVGSLLDFPELLAEKVAEDAARLAEGDCSLAIFHIRASAELPKQDFAQKVLASMPPALYSFVSARIACPRAITAEDARAELESNVRKMKECRKREAVMELILKLQAAHLAGDFEEELVILGRIKDHSVSEQ